MVQRSIHVPDELNNKLVSESIKARRTFSNYIVTILEQHIEDLELHDREVERKPKAKRSRRAA